MGSAAMAQQPVCNLWLGDAADSTTCIKQFAEQYLEIPTKLLPAGDNKIQLMQDDNQLAQIKIWLKPKKDAGEWRGGYRVYR